MDLLEAAGGSTRAGGLSVLAQSADLREMSWHGKRLALLRPLTYMNRSGEAVAGFLSASGLDPGKQLLVAFDDLDVPLGSVRLKLGGSAGTHRGMASIVSGLGHGRFPRLKMGIGPKPAGADAAEFVLAEFRQEERSLVESMLEKGLKLAEAVVCHGWDLAISKFHRKEP